MFSACPPPEGGFTRLRSRTVCTPYSIFKEHNRTGKGYRLMAPARSVALSAQALTKPFARRLYFRPHVIRSAGSPSAQAISKPLAGRLYFRPLQSIPEPAESPLEPIQLSRAAGTPLYRQESEGMSRKPHLNPATRGLISSARPLRRLIRTVASRQNLNRTLARLIPPWRREPGRTAAGAP